MRFTIRDLIWLTVVAAVALTLGLGWWRERMEVERRDVELRRWMSRHVDEVAESVVDAARVGASNDSGPTAGVSPLETAEP